MTDADSLMIAFEILRENSQLSLYGPHYNISPSRNNSPVDVSDNLNLTFIPIVKHSEQGRTLSLAIWPLIPFWLSGVVPKFSTANARSETITEKASYKHAWRRQQRCIVPATGFYEWQSIAELTHKQPWHIQHAEQAIMGFAGIWERSEDVNDDEIESCAIITTKANKLMAEIHNPGNRMPVIIDAQDREQWLCGNHNDADELLKTYRNDGLTAHPISRRINNPKFDSPECITPTEIGE